MKRLLIHVLSRSIQNNYLLQVTDALIANSLTPHLADFRSGFYFNALLAQACMYFDLRTSTKILYTQQMRSLK